MRRHPPHRDHLLHKEEKGHQDSRIFVNYNMEVVWKQAQKWACFSYWMFDYDGNPFCERACSDAKQENKQENEEQFILKKY